MEINAGLRLHRRNRQELVRAIGITGIPGPKGEKSFSDEFVTGVTKFMKSKRWHGSFDDVEPPTRESALIGNESEKEIECKFFWLEIGDPFFGSQPMVEPSE